jgi:membrane protease YdiL (CAAX protease family)
VISATQVNSFWYEIGLRPCAAFYRDVKFLFAVVAGITVLLINKSLVVLLPNTSVSYTGLLIFNLLLWYPVLEEILFRGILQGQLYKTKWGSSTLFNLSYANWVTSIIFASLHFIYHSPVWALLVVFPSLVFGYFRDIYNSIYPALALHLIYNFQLLYFSN